MKYSKQQIKDLILTDYLDGRLDEATKKEIDAVISKDPELAEFLDSVLQTSQKPFAGNDRMQPPEHVWQNIKEQIEASQAAPTVAENVLDRVRTLWARPRLSFVLGSVMTVLIIFIWVGTGRFQVPPTTVKSESSDRLMLLAGGGSVDPEDISNGFGTSIEDFFL